MDNHWILESVQKGSPQGRDSVSKHSRQNTSLGLRATQEKKLRPMTAHHSRTQSKYEFLTAPQTTDYDYHNKNLNLYQQIKQLQIVPSQSQATKYADPIRQAMISSGGFQILKNKENQNRHKRVQSAITLRASKIIRKAESSMDFKKFDCSVKDYVQIGENKRNGVWNVKGYKVPPSVMTDVKQVKGCILFSLGSEKVNFMTQQAKKKKDLPGPTSYKFSQDWKENNQNKNFQKFKSQEKMTYIDEIFKKGKKLKEPGPNYYKPKYTLIDVVKNPPDIKSPQLFMLDDCKVRAKESAGYIYKPKYIYVEPKSLGTQMYPKQRLKDQQIKGSRGGSRAHIIAKSKDPAVGCYETEKAISKTQESSIQWMFSKNKRVTFIENLLKKKKAVPGVGHYKLDKAYSAISSPLYGRRR